MLQLAARVAWAALGLGAAALAQAQGGPDELWNMTTRMEAAGMQMPPMAQEVCMKKGETRAESFSQDRNCKVTEQRRDGNKFTWKVVCTGADAMTGTGEMIRNRDTMSGRMNMRSKDGETVNIAYSGKLAGGCNAQTHKDPQIAAAQQQAAAAQAQGNAQMAQLCQESIDKYRTQMFEMKQSPCAARTGEYCAHVKKTAQSMRTPAGYRAAMGKEGMQRDGWESAATFCQVQTAPIVAAACKSAAGARDWPFVAEHCPAESEQIAAQHCAGREYTAVMKSEYKDVCAKHASSLARSSRASAKPAADPAQSDAVTEGVKEGMRGLRNLFGK